ncbi:MAG TPA: VWA domain-containing protein [Thermoanaerobaculia bacterium]
MSFRLVSLLWLLGLVPFILVFLVTRERLRARIARRFASERLRGSAARVRALRPWLLALALVAALVALAGPYAGYRTVPIVSREANRVIAIDVSNSMAADDVGTTRLAAAKALAKRIVAAHDGRVALVVFEAEAEVVSPLTSDTDAVASLLDTLQPGEVGQPGSDIGGAILTSIRLVETDIAQKADIIVISDGEDQGARTTDAVQRARSRAMVVHTILVGTSEGAAIRFEDGPLRDEQGQLITTYARADVLRSVARGAGGRLLENPFSERALDPLLYDGTAAVARRTEVRVPVDRYQWPLGLAFVLLLGASLAHRGAE